VEEKTGLCAFVQGHVTAKRAREFVKVEKRNIKRKNLSSPETVY
jgi:hypothetical protein